MGKVKRIINGVVTEVDDSQMVKTIENGVVVEKPLHEIKKKEPTGTTSANGVTTYGNTAPLTQSQLGLRGVLSEDQYQDKVLGKNNLKFQSFYQDAKQGRDDGYLYSQAEGIAKDINSQRGQPLSTDEVFKKLKEEVSLIDKKANRPLVYAPTSEEQASRNISKSKGNKKVLTAGKELIDEKIDEDKQKISREFQHAKDVETVNSWMQQPTNNPVADFRSAGQGDISQLVKPEIPLNNQSTGVEKALHSLVTKGNLTLDEATQAVKDQLEKYVNQKNDDYDTDEEGNHIKYNEEKILEDLKTGKIFFDKNGTLTRNVDSPVEGAKEGLKDAYYSYKAKMAQVALNSPDEKTRRSGIYQLNQLAEEKKKEIPVNTEGAGSVGHLAAGIAPYIGASILTGGGAAAMGASGLVDAATTSGGNALNIWMGEGTDEEKIAKINASNDMSVASGFLRGAALGGKLPNEVIPRFLQSAEKILGKVPSSALKVGGVFGAAQIPANIASKQAGQDVGLFDNVPTAVWEGIKMDLGMQAFHGAFAGAKKLVGMEAAGVKKNSPEYKEMDAAYKDMVATAAMTEARAEDVLGDNPQAKEVINHVNELKDINDQLPNDIKPEQRFEVLRNILDRKDLEAKAEGTKDTTLKSMYNEQAKKKEEQIQELLHPEIKIENDVKEIEDAKKVDLKEIDLKIKSLDPTDKTYEANKQRFEQQKVEIEKTYAEQIKFVKDGHVRVSGDELKELQPKTTGNKIEQGEDGKFTASKEGKLLTDEVGEPVKFDTQEEAQQALTKPKIRVTAEEAEKLSKPEPVKEVVEEIKTPPPPPKEETPLPTGGENENITGIKNKQTLSEREAKGLGEVEVTARRNFGDVFDKGKSMVDNGEINPRILAQSLAKEPRPLKAEESVALLYDRMRLHNEHRDLLNKIEQANKEGDEVAEGMLRAELELNEEASLINDEASRKTGYEQGLGLSARKMMIKEDYSLANQLTRFKVANEGKDIPIETREKLESLTKRLDEASLRIEEYEMKVKELEAQKKINTQKTSIRNKNKSSEDFKKERDDIFSSIKKKWDSSANDNTLTAVPIPYAKQLAAIAPEVAKLVKNYASQGITELGKIVDDIHSNLKDKIEGITKKDVTDLLAGVYNEKKERPQLDRKKMELQANVEKIKRQIDLEKEKIKLSNRTKGKKAIDWFFKWRRMALLSGVKVLGKIGVAAATRSGIVSPIESGISEGLRRIPGIKTIARGAPREGAGFNAKAEAKALSQWVDKMTYKDIKEVLKTGEGQLDYLYKDKLHPPPGWMDFFGQLHAAIKTLPKRSEFFRSFELRAEHAAKNGKDLTDPHIQQELAIGAYNDSLRSIFMNDNYLTDAYKSMLRSLENSKIEGASTTAKVLQFIFPIIKVPTNYVAETTSYIVGGAKAAFALRKGIKDLTPDQKDFVMRNLKKQTIGIAIMAIGYFNPQAVGGYYSGKRKDDDLESGDLTLFGMKLPHWMAHTPLLEALQFGATLRRVKDAEHRKGSNIFTGIPTAVSGLSGQIPFFSQGDQVGSALSSIDNFTKYVGRTGQGVVEPQLLKEIAEFTDVNLGENEKYDPENFIEQLMLGIPGLRESIGTKRKKKY